MGKKRTTTIAAIITLCVVALGIASFMGYKLYEHEINQNQKIQQLSEQITTLEQSNEAANQKIQQLSGKVTALEQKNTSSIEWGGVNDFNYLAIGNSITLHGYADYWWDNDRGMAASNDETDYVHLVTDHLKENSDSVVTHAYNFSSWETNGYDRAEFLNLLDPYLSKDIDLITIQLGENASDLATWESDWMELISYVKEKAPDAEILVIGDFWSRDNRDELKARAAESESVKYVNLDGIKDNREYYAGLGTEVEDSDGHLHAIEHEGVAIHPGDKGMSAIAERIVNAI